MLRKLVTIFQCPPIPVRGLDWVAYVDGDEETGKYGYGPTEEAAIADWVDSHGEEYEERDDARP